MPKKPYTGYLTLWNSGKRWALLSPRTHLGEQGIPNPRARTPKSSFLITELWRRRACENCCKSRNEDIRGYKSGFEERCLLIQSGHLGLQPLNRPRAALWPITRIRKYAVLPPHTVPLRRNMSTAPSMCSVYIPAFANKAALLRRAALFYHFAPQIAGAGIPGAVWKSIALLPVLCRSGPFRRNNAGLLRPSSPLYRALYGGRGFLHPPAPHGCRTALSFP